MSGPTRGAVDLEDRRVHLDFIQATVERMSTASTTTKGWMMPLVTATYGYALTQRFSSVALFGVAAVIVFAYLDANYLRQEARFRRLYMAVAEEADDIPAFSLNPDHVPIDRAGPEADWGSWMPRSLNRLLPGPAIWTSWSIGPFYAGLVAIGVAVALIA